MTEKAVLSTPEAWKYCGNRLIFERLLEEFPQLLQPFSVGKPVRPGASGKKKYLRASLDAALKSAQMARTFVES